MIRAGLALLVCLLAAAPAAAQRARHDRDARAVLQAFRPPTVEASRSVATLLVDGRTAALATVVGEEGLLLSKASELGEPLTCRLFDGLETPATVVARDPNFDVALVRAEVGGLVPVSWSQRRPAVGRLVVSVGPERPLAVGLIGVAPKRIEGGRGLLGVVLSFGVEGAVVASVNTETPAALAGLKADDRLLSIDGEAVDERRDAVRILRRRAAGETVTLRLRRAGDVLEREVMLAPRATVTSGRDAMMEGEQSLFRAGFPSALQHDSVLRPEECGGPLVGLDGRAVALNIARAGRVATYAIPAEDVARILARLKESAVSQTGATER